MHCFKCCKKLTFKSEKKKKYVYCKKCHAIMIQLGMKRCSCGRGFLRKCHYYSLCGNHAMRCKACESGWIDEYCWPCS